MPNPSPDRVPQQVTTGSGRARIVGFACLAVVAVSTYRACSGDSSRATGRERSYACELTTIRRSRTELTFDGAGPLRQSHTDKVLRGAHGVDKRRAARAYAGVTGLRLHPAQRATVRAQMLGGTPLLDTLIAALRDAGAPETQKLLAASAVARTAASADLRRIASAAVH